MEQLVTYIVQSLVDNPEDVKIQQIDSEKGIIIELRVAPADIGKVIGKNGRIAKSLRTILSAAGVKEGKTYSLEIVD